MRTVAAGWLARVTLCLCIAKTISSLLVEEILATVVKPTNRASVGVIRKRKDDEVSVPAGRCPGFSSKLDECRLSTETHLSFRCGCKADCTAEYRGRAARIATGQSNAFLFFRTG